MEKRPADQRDALRAAFQAVADKRTSEQQKLVATNPSLNISAGNLYQYNEKAAEELKKDAAVIQAKRNEKPVEDFVSFLTEPNGQPPATSIFHRGDHRQPKEPVTPAMLTIAVPPGQSIEFPVKDAALPTSGRRLAFAKHLVSGRDPLFPRALANRLWMHHFGRGLVGTPGDFGQLGERPTHPELLDWLAVEVVGGNGDGEMGRNASPHLPITPPPYRNFKRLHRLLMTSTTYRQSAARRPELDGVDPSNQLLGRMNVRRLDAEVMRDRVLVASGALSNSMFGNPIPVTEDFVGQVVVSNMSRRSVYVQQKRSKPETLMRAFDAPVMECNCDKRAASTVATQSLMLMNSEFVLKQAADLAARVRKESADTQARRASEGSNVADNSNHSLVRRASDAFDLNQLPIRPSDIWQIGYGEFDDSAKRAKSFAKFAHWTGSQWQGGASFPDEAIGYAFLNAAGGHTGNDQQHSPIRRWTALASGTVSITGSLHHPSENGDGVRCRIVSSRSGLAGEWIAEHKAVDVSVAAIEVQAGDTLDFITDLRETVTSDSFAWSIAIKLKTTYGKEISWQSDKSFPGPTPPPLANQIAAAWQIAYQRPITPAEFAAVCEFFRQQFASLSETPANADPELQALTDLCQAILSSNEFLYVD